MARKRYRLTIPYTEDHPDHPAKVFEAGVEVEASSVEEARELGLAEFHELARVSGSSWTRRVVADKIRTQEIVEKPLDTRFRIDQSVLEPGVVVCALFGVVDAHGMPDLQATVHAAIASKASALIVDLSKTSYVNSTCIGLLVGHLDDIRILLVGVPDRIGRVFKMLGIDTLFGTYRTVNDALKSIR